MDTALNYKKVLPQVKAYEYYMDEEFLRVIIVIKEVYFCIMMVTFTIRLSYNETLFAEYTASNKREDTSSDL